MKKVYFALIFSELDIFPYITTSTIIDYSSNNITTIIYQEGFFFASIPYNYTVVQILLLFPTFR